MYLCREKGADQLHMQRAGFFMTHNICEDIKLHFHNMSCISFIAKKMKR